MFQTCDNSRLNSENVVLNSEIEEIIDASAEFLREKLPYTSKIGILGTADLGCLRESLQNQLEIPLSTLPHFKNNIFDKIKGTMILGKISDIPVLYFQQEMYLYEGDPLWKCTIPIRIMKSLNIKILISINTAKAVNKLYKKDDVIIIEDHIDLPRIFGHFSLRGLQNNLLQLNYNPTERIYDKNLIESCLKIGKGVFKEAKIHKGIYTYSAGPDQESEADINLLRRFGSDFIGSSSVHEAIVAKSCGMMVFGFGLIKSTCWMNSEEEEVDFGVLQLGSEVSLELVQFLEKVVVNVHQKIELT